MGYMCVIHEYTVTLHRFESLWRGQVIHQYIDIQFHFYGDTLFLSKFL